MVGPGQWDELEYFLNAHIVGMHINARSCMLLMKAAFGPPGLIDAPIYYAYLKSELEVENLL